MSLVADIQNALKSVASSLPDAAKEMVHGFESGTALRGSSVEMTGESATESGAVEKSRVIVDAADFPSLGSDALVYVADEPFIVTSLKTDPVGASMTVGLSSPLHQFTALWQGVRAGRAVNQTVDLLAEDNGLTTEYGESYSPISVHSWTIVISRESWLHQVAPQVGDDISFGGNHLKAARVIIKEKSFIVNARSR